MTTNANSGLSRGWYGSQQTPSELTIPPGFLFKKPKGKRTGCPRCQLCQQFPPGHVWVKPTFLNVLLLSSLLLLISVFYIYTLIFLLNIAVRAGSTSFYQGVGNCQSTHTPWRYSLRNTIFAAKMLFVYFQLSLPHQLLEIQ